MNEKSNIRSKDVDGTLSYIADSFLLARTFQILSELEEENGSIKKQADLSSMLSDAGKSLQSTIGSQIHGKDSGGILRTVVDFLAPATFFRLSPVLGILVTVAELFGFDIYGVLQKIVGAILPKLQSGQKVSAQEINDAGKAAIPQSTQVFASNDLLSSLRELDAIGHVKNGGPRDGLFDSLFNAWQTQKTVPETSNPWIRMFSFLSPGKRGSLITGILVWFVKTILLSAGLLAVGGLAAGALGFHPSGTSGSGSSSNESGTGTQGTTVSQNTQDTSAQSPVQTFTKPAPTGAGSLVYRKKPSDIWVENLGSNQPYEQVLDWVIDSYPILDQYQDIILRTPSFWNVVRDISKQWHPGQVQLVIPEPYTKRDDVINVFVNDVFAEIQQQRGML